MNRDDTTSSRSAGGLIDAGLARWKSGDHGGGAAHFDEALRLQRALIAAPGGLAEHGAVFIRWIDWPVQAMLSQDDAYLVENRDYTQEALVYARDLGEPSSLAQSLVHAGLARWKSGDHGGGAAHFDEALRLQRALIAAPGGLAEHGAVFIRWIDWPVQAMLSQDDAYLVENRDYTQEALVYARDLGEPSSLAQSLVHAGLARWKSGDHGGGAAHFDEALRLQRALIAAPGGLAEHGAVFIRWIDWPVQAMLSQDDAYLVENRDYTQEALVYARDLGEPSSLAQSLVHAGLARWKSGDHGGGAAHFDEALRLQRALIAAPGGLAEHGAVFIRWIDWPVQAMLSQDDAYLVENRDYTQEALVYARDLGEPSSLAQSLVHAGLARWKSGDHGGGAAHFDEALRLQRALIAAPGGLAEHGAVFIRWIDWPVQAMLSQDDAYRRQRAALLEEADVMTRALRR